MLLDGARAAGVDPYAMRRAFGLVEEWVGAGLVPGAAVLVARGGRIAGEAYLGLADGASQRKVDSDTVWSLASITKPFTATAVMMQVEAGLFSLDEPLWRLMPDFTEGAGRAASGRFDRTAVTPWHLLTHTSGLPGVSPDNIALRKANEPLVEFVRSFGSQPLFFEPGAYHLYSNPGIVLAAELVARSLAGSLGTPVSAPMVEGYHPMVQEKILARLGMNSSALRPPQDWDSRIARVEGTGQSGTTYEMANSAYYRGLGIPWGGLFSRPRELVRFVDLFLPLAGGRQRIGLAGDGPGPRLLAPSTVARMTSLQCAPPDAPLDVAPTIRDGALPTSVRPSVAWGIGWQLKGEARGHPFGDLTSKATYGHRGASGTMAWADPESDVACVLLTNQTLASQVWTDRPRMSLFSNAVMAAVR